MCPVAQKQRKILRITSKRAEFFCDTDKRCLHFCKDKFPFVIIKKYPLVPPVSNIVLVQKVKFRYNLSRSGDLSTSYIS